MEPNSKMHREPMVGGNFLGGAPQLGEGLKYGAITQASREAEIILERACKLEVILSTLSDRLLGAEVCDNTKGPETGPDCVYSGGDIGALNSFHHRIFEALDACNDKLKRLGDL